MKQMRIVEWFWYANKMIVKKLLEANGRSFGSEIFLKNDGKLASLNLLTVLELEIVRIWLRVLEIFLPHVGKILEPRGIKSKKWKRETRSQKG